MKNGIYRKVIYLEKFVCKNKGRMEKKETRQIKKN